jgi:flagellar basal-body rod modification protein FlgD
MSIASALSSAASRTAAASGASTTGAGGFGSDFKTFLTLLTTQLQNQDPTDAMDTDQMTSQLVQFAQVEQQIRLNDSMQTLIGLQEASQLTASATLLGKVVEVESDHLSLQDGAATLRLPAAGAATLSTVRVLGSGGAVLREQQVALGAQAQDWTWDGRDAKGNRQPDGAYAFTVTGTDAAGAAQAVDATVRARATGAERRNGALNLMLGGLAVGFGKVRSLPSD